jgi:hypothetical protein
MSALVRSNKTGWKGKTRLLLSVATAAAVSLMLGIAGCSDDDGNTGGGDDGGDTKGGDDVPGVIDLALVTGEGEAWVTCVEHDWGEQCGTAYVFLSNGNYRTIYGSGNDWTAFDVNSWSTSGNQLILKRNYESSYVLSGNNTLTLFDDEFTRMPGITNVVICGSGASSSGSRDNRLVNGENEAWMDCDYNDYLEKESCFGFILRSNGDFITLRSSYYDDGFQGFYEGSWTTQGNNRIVITDLWTRQYSISSDNTMTITGYVYYEIENGVCELIESDWEDTYTKRSGLTITEYSE